MTIDHVTWLLFPGCQKIWWVILLHVIGRLTAPIMWFLMAEGFHYTRNVKKYIGRLFLFAVISHFAYNFAGGIPLIPNGFFNMTCDVVACVVCRFNGYIPNGPFTAMGKDPACYIDMLHNISVRLVDCRCNVSGVFVFESRFFYKAIHCYAGLGTHLCCSILYFP